MRESLGIVVLSVVTAGCLGTDDRPCFIDESFTSLEPGRDSLAFRVFGVPEPRSVMFASYRGAATNLSATDPCAFATWHFPEPPDPQALPVVSPETPPSGVLPGGGTLRHTDVLPKIGEHQFMVDLAPPDEFAVDIPQEMGRLDETVVIAFCEDAHVGLDLRVEVIGCLANDARLDEPDEGVIRLW